MSAMGNVVDLIQSLAILALAIAQILTTAQIRRIARENR